MVLIIAGSSDAHSDAVLERLEKRGTTCVCFETQHVLRQQLSVGYPPLTGTLRIEGREVPLCEIEAVWYRNSAAPHRGSRVLPHREFLEDECEHLVEGVWCLLQERFWSNPYPATVAIANRIHQLQIAHRQGLRIPRTLVTNEPREVLAFFESCQGQMIYKVLSDSTSMDGGVARRIYTTKIDRDDLYRRLDQITGVPCLFQEYVPKKLDLRVVAIGGQVFPVEIHSQELMHAKIDWKLCRGTGFEKIVRKSKHFSPQLHGAIQKIMRECHLVFASLDFIVTPECEPVFTQLNTDGEWLWAEEITGMPIAEELCELLVRRRPRC